MEVERSSHRVFDAHVDSLQKQLDLGTLAGGHLDLERGRRGGLTSAVFVCWVDPKYVDPASRGARTRVDALLGAFHELTRDHSDRLRFAGNGRMLEAVREAGAIAGIPGIEGGHAIEEDLDTLHHFFLRGIRVLTLVWNNHLSWVRSCRDGAGPAIPEGLSDFGRSVVRAMNELGMLVDLSHAGERSFYDAIDASSAPAIASHSGCRALHDHPRNLTDDQLRALARNGGVVGIPFCVAFLSRDAQEEDARLRKTPAYLAIRARNDTELALEQGRFLQKEAAPLPMDRVVDHLVHAALIAGVDHVGIGSDYDGIGRTPCGLEDASCYGALAERLLARGFAAEDVAKVMAGNMERTFAQATGPGTAAARTGKSGFR
jgi:membrane dipeptidase